MQVPVLIAHTSDVEHTRKVAACTGLSARVVQSQALTEGGRCSRRLCLSSPTCPSQVRSNTRLTCRHGAIGSRVPLLGASWVELGCVSSWLCAFRLALRVCRLLAMCPR